MRRPLIVANWKMNGSVTSVSKLVADLRTNPAPEMVDVVLCPSLVHIPLVRDALAGSSIGLGAQTVSEHDEGAFTGEVSVTMLKELGCQYVIVGHSERRALFDKTVTQIVAKVHKVLSAGMIPILCVGETLAQREANETEMVIGSQVNHVLKALSQEELDKLVIAYEPVWAIGTGKTATPEEAQSVHAFIRGLWEARREGVRTGPDLRVLYGGSVKADNASPIFAQPDVDGGLVGGASLDAAQFIAIIQAASKA